MPWCKPRSSECHCPHVVACKSPLWALLHRKVRIASSSPRSMLNRHPQSGRRNRQPNYSTPQRPGSFALRRNARSLDKRHLHSAANDFLAVSYVDTLITTLCPDFRRGRSRTLGGLQTPPASPHRQSHLLSDNRHNRQRYAAEFWNSAQPASSLRQFVAAKNRASYMPDEGLRPERRELRRAFRKRNHGYSSILQPQ